MRRLIFVHGINNERWQREEIQTMWADALRAALGSGADDWWDEVEIRTAYYADLLAQETNDERLTTKAPYKFSALLFSPLCLLCSTEGITSPFATP